MSNGAIRLLRRQGWGLALLLLPLLVLGWSQVQLWRLGVAQAQAQVMRQWLDAPSDTLLQALPKAERNPYMPQADRRERLQREVDRYEAGLGGQSLRKVLAVASGLLAVLALLTAAGAWLRLRLDAWRALRSFEFLQQHMTQRWRALGKWLVLHLGLLAAALSLALLYELSVATSRVAEGGLTVLFIVLPLASCVLVCLQLARRLHRRWPLVLDQGTSFLGRALDRDSAPGVWRWVEGLAAQLQAPVPDNIVVGLDQGFFVTSVPILLQPAGLPLAGRTLYLPLPYLGMLSQAESGAVIGHELGHFRHQDTERASQTNAQFSMMRAHFSALVGDEEPAPWTQRPTLWMAWQFLHHFQRAVLHWGRSQELLADQAGAAVGGQRLFAQTLLRIIALQPAVDTVLATCGGQGIDRALPGYLEHHPLQVGDEVLGAAMAHPFDTHPAAASRLQALGVAPDPALLSAATRKPGVEERHWFGRLCAGAHAQAD
ncbi:M48 family metallopeptidase [Pseudomonas fulva]|uniref:M48 family metallopeptidase n=1 Tax=Pseudomonas fulva TaxID=47880 RepID=UPI0018AC69A5|nr:M48 family metallopeptidase [Pseudomonas fulva]MBF8675658.1 M48 family metallopeptidase [Pseudomonas fulva]MBF8697729.1 M48 family metallopeptidase [Pseudomonas fulva]